jgi:hypothetical protein
MGMLRGIYVYNHHISVRDVVLNNPHGEII